MQCIAFSIYITREHNCHCNQWLFRITHSADSSPWCRMIRGTFGQFGLTLNAVKDHQKTEEKKQWENSSNQSLLFPLFIQILKTSPSWRLPTIDTFMRSSYVLLNYSSLLGDFSPEKHRGLMFMKALYASWLLQIHSPFKVYCTILKTKNLIVNTTIQEDNRVKQAIKVFLYLSDSSFNIKKKKINECRGKHIETMPYGE